MSDSSKQALLLIAITVCLILVIQPNALSALIKRPEAPRRVLSQAEMQLFTATANSGEIVMVGANGVLIDQGSQSLRVGTGGITLFTNNTQRMNINSDGLVGIGTDTVRSGILQITGSATGLNNTVSDFMELSASFTRKTTSAIQNAASFGIAVGPKEALVDSVSRTFFQLGSYPVSENLWGEIPNQIVMTLQGDGNVGIGHTKPSSRLHVLGNRINLHNSGLAPNIFPGVFDEAQRAQMVLSSMYSDMVIASCASDPNYGSTLTFAAYDPNNGNIYRKWVVNQGGWSETGGRKSFLDFSYMDSSQQNPYAVNNDGKTPLTLDGLNGYVGIGTKNPKSRLQVCGGGLLSELGTGTGSCAIFSPAGNNQYGMSISITGDGNTHLQGQRFVDDANNKDSFPITLNAQGGNVGIGTNSPLSRLHVLGNRINLHNSGLAPNIFPGVFDEAQRAQMVLSSMYSDMVIASCATDANYGSTLTFAAYDPNNGNIYRKWVVNQGGWSETGGRKSFLDFSYMDSAQQNPHTVNISGKTPLTLDGINGYVGIGTKNPAHQLHLEAPENTWNSICLGPGLSEPQKGPASQIFTPDSFITGTGDLAGAWISGRQLFLTTGQLHHSRWGADAYGAPIVIRAHGVKSRGDNGAGGGTNYGGAIYLDSGPIVARRDGGSSTNLSPGDIFLRTGNIYTVNSEQEVINQGIDWTTRLFIKGVNGTVGIGTVDTFNNCALTVDTNFAIRPRTFKVGGNINTWYKVKISSSTQSTASFSITRGMNQDSSQEGSMTLDAQFRGTNCGNESQHLAWKYNQASPVGRYFIARVSIDDAPDGCSESSCYIYLLGERSYDFIGTQCYINYFSSDGTSPGSVNSLSTRDEPFSSNPSYCSSDWRTGISYRDNLISTSSSFQASGVHRSYRHVHSYFAGGGEVWSPGDPTNWPWGGAVFYITFKGDYSLGNNCIRGHFLVFHSRWSAGNNSGGHIEPIVGNYVTLNGGLTDGGMSFVFGSPAAQNVEINILVVG